MSYLETIMEARDPDGDTALAVDTYVNDSGPQVRFRARRSDDSVTEIYVTVDDADKLAEFIRDAARRARAEYGETYGSAPVEDETP